MRVPTPMGMLESIDELLSKELPERFVLKFASGWSSRGVMLLERVAPGVYFDHMSLRARSLAEIRDEQRRVADSFSQVASHWLLEELIQTTLPVGAVPFDYKFYCFDGVIGMIGQFDRNANPPRSALFDGGFRPLRLGRDYLIRSSRLQRGVPVIPLHAPEMMWWAQSLSQQVDAPFVSVDMYDSPDGPVFGEFTYSPGGTYKRMFVFSHAMLDRFDALFAAERKANDLTSTPLDVRRALPAPAAPLYRVLAGYTYNNGPRGAARLSDFYDAASRELEEGTEQRQWMQHLSDNWRRLHHALQGRLRADAARITKRA